MAALDGPALARNWMKVADGEARLNRTGCWPRIAQSGAAAAADEDGEFNMRTWSLLFV